jgi:O-antigen/teichoic acid export membrane protein
VSEEEKLPRKYRYSTKRFLRRGATAGIIRITGLLSIFALQVCIARVLGDPAEYGVYAWGQSLLFMVGIMACVGIPMVASRFVASLAAQHNQAAIGEIIRKSLSLLVRTAALPVLIAIPVWLFWDQLVDNNIYRSVATTALLCAPVVTFSFFLRDISRARQWLVLALLPLQVLRPWLTGLFVLGGWWLFTDPVTGQDILLMVSVSLTLTMLGHAAIYSRWHRAGATRETEPFGTIDKTISDEYHSSKIFGTAIPVFIGAISGQVMRYSNVLLVGFLAGPAAAGAYFAAERLASLAAIPKTVVSMVNSQSIAAAHAAGKERQLQLLATQSAHGSLWITLGLSVFLVVFAGPLIEMFGRGFSEGSLVLIILVASGIIGVSAGPVSDILIMTGHQNRVPGVMVAAAITHITALALLVPSYGAVGAATASVISTLFSQIWLVYLAGHYTGISTTILGSFRSNSRHD